VEELRVGDPVWTANESGERVAGTVLRTGNVRFPASHEIVNVTLRDGRELWVSPGHPTVDGRRINELRIGDKLDGSPVTQLEWLSYDGGSTFDILPSGDTGFYWANGILLASTLRP
jgi:hypothetical protein